MKLYKIIILIGILNLMYSCNNNNTTIKDALSIDCINDSIDQVRIGNQIWMTKNLDVCAFRNGDQILQVKNEKEMNAAADEKKPCWCYRNYDSIYNHLYGKLYNWYAVIDTRGLAPDGYRVPSMEDYEKLSETLGGKLIAGKKMKAKCGWRNVGLDGSIQDFSDNESGFSALPGSALYDNSLNSLTALDIFVGTSAEFWTSSEPSVATNDFDANYVELISGSDFFSVGWGQRRMKMYFMPVRCVKNLQ